MSAFTLLQPASEADLAAVRGLCRAYRADLAARAAHCPGIVENAYPEEAYNEMLKRLPAIHARPRGAIFLARASDGSALACGMTHQVGPATCEIKRVFVAPEARGMGLGRRIVLAAIEQARADGHETMVLDTMAWLSEAIALYAALGFSEIAPFYDPDPRFAPHLRFFGKALA